MFNVPAPGFGLPVAAVDRLAEIRYGLRSPNFEKRVEAVKNFVELLPSTMLEQNPFRDALNNPNPIAYPPYQDIINAAVKEAVAFLDVAITDTSVVANVDRMAQAAYFFNLLGKFVNNAVHSAMTKLQDRQRSAEMIIFLDQLTQAKEEVRQLKQDKASLENENRKQLEASAKEVSDLRQEFESKLSEEVEQRQMVEEDRVFVSELLKEIELLEEKVRDMERKEKENEENVARSMDDLKEIISEADAKKRELQLEIDELRSEIQKSDEFQEEQHQAIEDLSRKLSDQAELEMEVEHYQMMLDDRDSEIEDLLNERSELTKQFEEQKQEVENLMSVKNDLAEKLNCALTKEEDLEREKQALKNRIERYDLYVYAQRTQIEKMEKSTSELKEMKLRVDVAESKIAILEAMVNEKDFKIESLQKELVHASTEAENLIERPKTVAEALQYVNAIVKSQKQ